MLTPEFSVRLRKVEDRRHWETCAEIPDAVIVFASGCDAINWDRSCSMLARRDSTDFPEVLSPEVLSGVLVTLSVNGNGTHNLT